MLDNLKKHSGILKNTGVRIAVVFRKLPNDDTSCLIVETERLPDSYHDTLMQTMNSREASETNDFYEILNRRTFPDGSNCLTSLHQRGFLRKEPITNVTMLPLPGQAVPLGLINATIDKKVDEYKKSQEQATTLPVVADIIESHIPIDTLAIAKGLIAHAEMLERDAKTKRDEAYDLAPELKPGMGRPPLDANAKAKAAQDRKDKRRERDRENAKKAKDSKVDAQVAAKLARDAERLSSVQS